MGRVIEKLGTNKPASYVLRQRVLFRRDGEPSFLAVIWDQPTVGKVHFELHQVTVVSPTNVRLTWRNGLEAPGLSIVEPSGLGVHGDDLPILYLAAGDKQRGFSQEELHVIRLDRASVRLMTREPVRPVRVMDLDGDGRYALIASDDRWGDLFEDCQNCGPLVPLLYTWHEDEYRPDCRWYPDYFEQRAKLLERRVTAAADMRLPTYVGLRMEIVLGLLQGGRIEDAETVFADTEAALKGPLTQRWAKSEIDRYWAFAKGTFGPVIEAAAAHANDACPVLGYTGPARPVALEPPPPPPAAADAETAPVQPDTAGAAPVAPPAPAAAQPASPKGVATQPAAPAEPPAAKPAEAPPSAAPTQAPAAKPAETPAAAPASPTPMPAPAAPAPPPVEPKP